MSQSTTVRKKQPPIIGSRNGRPMDSLGRGPARFFRHNKSVLTGLRIRMSRRWMILASTFLVCAIAFFYFGLPFLTGPRLTQDQKQWKEFPGDDARGYPLEVLSHGYRMIRASRREPPKKDENPRASVVEWEWKVVIRNNSPRDEQVYVQYLLADKDRLPVDVDYRISPQAVAAWETVTVQHRTEMVYDDLPRIAQGVWEITWGGSGKKTKGY